MGALGPKPRYWCGQCHKAFKTLKELQYHPHPKAVTSRDRALKKTANYYCLKCKMRHTEGVVSYVSHMKFKRAKGRPKK